ncbi:MAG: ATP-dependent zinc metalloprotease FtsH [Selenomonadaceae bacterium]|nr:ATP-dependent zinc metalloprotease FtsH [Selenomonadaceae bacterium]MBP3722815.1 ATP-dependent zinc metalloprotease FtsH [Selenomonadaceae bacterium]
MVFYFLIVLVAVTFIDYFSAQKTPKRVDIGYSELLTKVDAGEVSEVVIVENLVKGKLADGTDFSTITPGAPNNDTAFLKTLKEKNVPMKAENPPEPPWWTGMITSIFPILLLVGLWFFIMQQSQGGGMGKLFGFGRSHAKMMLATQGKAMFADVAGADEAKEELEEVVEFLKQPQKFYDLGARIPKGVLLFGPPGTGKTLLARAVAGEAGVPFFSISGSDFVEMFVGVGASRVRDLFEQAKLNAPCIVFIDEIDAVGRQRGAGVGGGHDEREQTLNQLLVEMDGFAANEGIIIIAATNRPDILDPALLRPGRFDRQIVVDKPDVKGRKAILEVHTKGKPIAGDVNLDILARRTPGFTGADLSNLVNEAALLSARRNKKTIAMAELEESIERVMAGPERKSHVMSDEEKKLTAYHEGGHALIGLLVKHADPVHKVTIIPRGRAGGYTLMLPKEDRSYATRSELIDRLKVAMGGRVAEEVVLGEISTGASQDIKQASRIVRSMIKEYGMSETLGPIAYGETDDRQTFLGRMYGDGRNYSENVASEIDAEIRKYMNKVYNDCRDLVIENRGKLDLIANALLERETLTAKELEELMTTGEISTPLIKEEEVVLDKKTEEKKEPPKDDDKKPKPGDPAYIGNALLEKVKNTMKEAEEMTAPKPNFNATKYDK